MVSLTPPACPVDTDGRQRLLLVEQNGDGGEAYETWGFRS